VSNSSADWGWDAESGSSEHLLRFPQCDADAALLFAKTGTVARRILESGKVRYGKVRKGMKGIKGRDRDWAETIIKLCIK